MSDPAGLPLADLPERIAARIAAETGSPVLLVRLHGDNGVTGRAQGAPSYVDGITEAGEEPDKDMRLPDGQGEEDLYDRAVAIVVRDRKASTSYLQRRLSIGYNRAADLIERMEADGLISAANHAGKREILASGGGTASGGKQDAA